MNRRDRMREPGAGDGPDPQDDDAFFEDELDPATIEDPIGGSLAATALWGVLGALAVALATIWIAPKLAPIVPAPIGRFLAPVRYALERDLAGMEQRIAEARAAHRAEIAALEARIAALTESSARQPQQIAAANREIERLGAALRTAGATADAARAASRAAIATAEQARDDAVTADEDARAATDAAGRVGSALAAVDRRLTETDTTLAAARRERTDLARRIASVDRRIGTVRGEVAAMRDGTAAATGGDEPAASAEVLAALETSQARLDALEAGIAETPPPLGTEAIREIATGAARRAIDDTAETLLAPARAEAERATEASDRLAARIAALETRLAAETRALEARLEATEARAAETRAAALDETGRALRGAAIRGAADALATRLRAGEPYAAALAELEALAGRTVEPALSRHAERGIVTVETLMAQLPDRARAALEAKARAEGTAPSTRVTSWLRAQVFARPDGEQTGSGLPARLSRIEARLAERDLDAAFAEAEALPAPAALAMADWTAALAERIAAERALAAFVAAPPTPG